MPPSDFQLPELAQTRTGTSLACWIVPTAWAYSSRWNNNRCLEGHFYSIWNFVLQDLVADLAPYIFVVSQYQIDSLHHGPVRPDESIATAAQVDATGYTPDFSIVKSHVILWVIAISIDRHPFTSWNDFTVKALIVPLIAELKHTPSHRNPSLKLFIEELVLSFKRAHCCLENQADNAFAMQSTEVDKIILVACVGKWWNWKTATHDHYITDSNTSSNASITALFTSVWNGKITNYLCFCLYQDPNSSIWNIHNPL